MGGINPKQEDPVMTVTGGMGQLLLLCCSLKAPSATDTALLKPAQSCGTSLVSLLQQPCPGCEKQKWHNSKLV